MSYGKFSLTEKKEGSKIQENTLKLKPKTCECGKEFFVFCNDTEWTYRRTRGSGCYNYYCSWSCFNGGAKKKKKLAKKAQN